MNEGMNTVTKSDSATAGTFPQLDIRPAAARGMADHGWLKSAHSFSFASYYDPAHMQYGPLRVINDDTVAGGGGFPAHPHRDAEIFSYVTQGALTHQDSMGNGSTVHAGGIQYMSAGTGVTHSEFNASADETVKFLQVWLLPEKQGSQPRYETRDLDESEKSGTLKLFLSPDGRDGSMATQANALVYAATLTGEQRIEHDLGGHDRAWLQMVKGSLSINGVELEAGDGLAMNGGGKLDIRSGKDAEFLLFEL